MTDIRIRQSGSLFEAVTLDFLLTDAGDLDTANELATAATVALFTDRLALPSDELPDPSSGDRRGWWADVDAGEIWDGWPIGCRLWLLSRAKITPGEAREGATTARVEAYIYEAFEPFRDRGICDRVEVNARRRGLEQIDAQVTLYRRGRVVLNNLYDDLWRGIVIQLPYA